MEMMRVGMWDLLALKMVELSAVKRVVTTVEVMVFQLASKLVVLDDKLVDRWVLLVLCWVVRLVEYLDDASVQLRGNTLALMKAELMAVHLVLRMAVPMVYKLVALMDDSMVVVKETQSVGLMV